MRPNQQSFARAILAAAVLTLLAVCTWTFIAQRAAASAKRDEKTDKASTPATVESAKRGQIIESYGKLPLSFEANQGQTDARVKFFARGRGYDLYLTATEAIFALKKENKKTAITAAVPSFIRPATQLPHKVTTTTMRMKLVGANPTPQAEGVDQLTGKINYFGGNDHKQWHTDIPTFAKVRYRNIYPGVDLIWHGEQGRIKYDLIVAPGVDPRIIKLRFEGAQQIRHAADGNLLVRAAGRELWQDKPVIWQEQGGLKKEIAGHYVILDKRSFGFAISQYDPTKPLVIDPTLIYSTYLGGSGADQANGIAVDAQGFAYIVGTTRSTDFPLKPNITRPTDTPPRVFVTKLNATGSEIIYSSFIGVGTGFAIAVDSNGNAYITGSVYKYTTLYPTTPNAFQREAGNGGAFVTKLNAGGNALIYSTILGYGTNEGTRGRGIAVDNAGNIYVTGIANNYVGGRGEPLFYFPTTSNAFQKNWAGGGDAFVIKIDPSKSGESSLVYSSLLGGDDSRQSIKDPTDEGVGIALDSLGLIYITGYAKSHTFPTTTGAFQASHNGGNCLETSGAPFGYSCPDAFVTKLNLSLAGSAGLIYSTFLGATPDCPGGTCNSSSGSDYASGIAVDSFGNAYITGETWSSKFPTTPGAFRSGITQARAAFVTKLNSAGSLPVYSALIQGANSGNAIAVDSLGSAYITGFTRQGDFPVTPDAFQSQPRDCRADAFLMKLNPAGNNLIYSTLLGGEKACGSNANDTGIAIALDSVGDAYLAGYTNSSNFPTRAALQSGYKGEGDAFVAKFAFGNQQQLTLTAILPNKGGNSGTVTPTLYGTGFVAGTSVKLKCSGQADILGENPTPLGNGFAASYAATFNLKDKTPGVCDVVVTRPDGASVTLPRGFVIEQEGQAQVWVDILGREVIRGGRNQTYLIQYGNSGNIDAESTTIWVSFPKYLTWKLPSTVQASSLGPTDIEDTFVSFDIQRITAGGGGVIPINFAAPDDPIFAHKIFDIKAWQDDPDYIDSSQDQELGFTYLGLTEQSTRSEGNCKSVPDAECNQPLCNEPMSPAETVIRNMLATNRIYVNNCPCRFPGAKNCTDVAGLKPATVQRLIELRIEWGCPIVITGGSEKGIHSPTAGHEQGVKVDIRACNCVSNKIKTYNPICSARGICKVCSKDSQQCTKTNYEVFRWQSPNGIIFRCEKCPDHWDIDLRKDNICGANVHRVEIVTSNDPNDKVGSHGAGITQWLSNNEPLRYTIYFENKPTATADAQIVVINDQLDLNKIDLTTLSIGPISFLDKIITPQASFNPLLGSNEFRAEVDLRPARNLIVRSNVTVNQQIGLLAWNFTTIDPTTGEIPPLDGFLPKGQGGSVSFTVQPKLNLPTGTQIKNKASITFDFNAPLGTPEWFNTLDQTKPVSRVLALNATQASPSFPVKWSGTDAGAGVQDYTIFVSENSGPFTTWLANSTATEAMFPGQNGSRYAFYSVARDLVGHVEGAKTSPEATTLVSACNALTVTAAPAITRQQGNAGSVATLATVANAQTAGNVTVTATSVPAGITVSNLSNSNGVISANMTAACNAAVGANNLVLSVGNGCGAAQTVNLTINVTANTKPALGTYSATGIGFGASATVTPSAAPVDNGSITSIAAAAPNFAGTFSVNPTTGAVTISNARPGGDYTVTVTATDNCGAVTTTTFPLTVGKLSTNITLTASDGPYINGQPVTLTAVVVGSPLPTGTATFSDNGNVLGTVALNLFGQAALTTTALGIGARTITVSYSGDGNFGSATSPVLRLNVARAIMQVSAASFRAADFAAEQIVVVFGTNLATQMQPATSTPLPTTLVGTSVSVRDSIGIVRNAPLFFVSPTQVNYQMPPGTATGQAIITITGVDNSVSIGRVNITAVAPGLFAANSSGQGVAAAVVLRVKPNGVQSFEPVARFDQAQNRFIAVPIDIGPGPAASDQVFLILFGTGLRGRSALTGVKAQIGGVAAESVYAGRQASLIGVDQVNVRMPPSLAGRGEVEVTLSVDGVAANPVRISIK
jgi:uncharacterized protein (TIGR03437 family)